MCGRRWTVRGEEGKEEGKGGRKRKRRKERKERKEKERQRERMNTLISDPDTVVWNETQVFTWQIM